MGHLFDLKGRFVAMALLIMGVIAAEGIVGIQGIGMVRDRIEMLDQVFIPLIRALSRIESLHVQLNHQFEKAPRDETSPDRLVVNRRIIHDQTTRIAHEVSQGLLILEAAAGPERLPEIRGELLRIRQNLEKLRELQSRLTGIVNQIPVDAADGTMHLSMSINRQLVDESENQESLSDQLLELAEDVLGRAMNMTLRLSDKTVFMLIAVWVVSLVVCVVLVLILAVSILRPLHLAQKAVSSIAKGEMDIQFVSAPHAHDELGRLLDAMRAMAQALRERERVGDLMRQSEKMSSLGRLAIGLAHDVNNPLANAVLNLEVMEMELTDHHPPEMHSRVAMIRRNVEKAMAITRELLNFSRPDLPGFTTVALHDAIDGVLLLLGQRLRSIRVDLQYDPELPEVLGMSGKLQQVFMNLIQNAIEAMPHGGLLVIRTSLEERWGVVEIRDSGPGIPPSLCGKVLEPFFTTRVEEGGVGLGLAVCQSIVEQHGGMLVLDTRSAPEGGLRVVVRIPLPASSDIPQDPKES
ncbi:MAG: HAMP domain-containing protein [Magnetococcales bacterium]|nr:HAMP domain-containing protein [Magnetococcales bacterium]